MSKSTGLFDYNKIRVSADEILPGIWLGNEASSQNIDWLKSKNIKNIVNCTKHIPCSIAGIKYMRIPINDPGLDLGMSEDNSTLVKSAEKLTDFINQADSNNEPVLVHCHAGMQRSAGALAIYLIKTRFKKNPLAALKLLRRRRPLVFDYGNSVNFITAIDHVANQ